MFLDSPVANIGYRTATKEGVTDANGEYEYSDGETVTFFIGELEFPPVTASGTVTPLDLAGTDNTADSTVVNITRLLQSLDDDGDPDNGISIASGAEDWASAVDFSQSVSDFEASAAVTTLVANSGAANTTLVSESEAIAHFEDTLVSEGETFVANANISGVWTSNATANDLLAFIFFADGTYVHLEVDEDDPIDVPGEMSGMEWGTYSRDSETGQVTVSVTFDDNGDTGISGFEGSDALLLTQVSGDLLTLQFDDNGNGTIDEGESLELLRSQPSGLVGAWATSATDNDLLAFVFFADGTYLHLEVDEALPIDSPNETSGMEWGTYTRNSETGQLTVTQTFDGNGDTGLTDFAAGVIPLFAQVNGDVLTLQIDENLNGTIDPGESLELQRQ
ncbi:hypothetical protein [Motiliproteus sp. SC1-56]|uniref:hypothetical protein n=1 Tax=Motiliproteus sp. SC1-56 TaxID=2799565 RepID=UPI001A8DDFA0|nr:hypothetical protein [Motiliproteus sp. SC1-56]